MRLDDDGRAIGPGQFYKQTSKPNMNSFRPLVFIYMKTLYSNHCGAEQKPVHGVERPAEPAGVPPVLRHTGELVHLVLVHSGL
jgi:hypothetical protein